MRISLKHLLLGMSLGAVVVLIYGINKLTPFTSNVAQTSQNIVETGMKNVPVEELLEPKIVEDLYVSFDKEVQFLNIYKQYNIDPIISKDNNSRLASDRSQTTDNVETSETETSDSIKEIIKPEVAFYIYERPKVDVQPIAFYQFKSPFVTEERNQIPTPTPEPTPTIKQVVAYTASNTSNSVQETNSLGASENIIALIEKYALEYGVDKNMMIGIAKCESGFRENAINGPYAGIYQFVSGTWISNRRAMGLDENLDLRFNAEEAVRTAAFKMNRDGFGAWPVCQHKARRLLVTNTQNL